MVLLDEADGFPAGSAEPSPSVPPNPDALTLEKLKSAQPHSGPVNNEFLKMKPEDIPRDRSSFYDAVFKRKQFLVDDLCILTDDKINTTDGECWEKLERGQGWGVAGDAEWVGWKRTFVYKPRQPRNSNKSWFLKVFAAFEVDGYIKPLYECFVFEDYNFNPRPKCVSQVSAAFAYVDTIQEDSVEVKSLAKQLEAIAANPNLLPYGERSLSDMFWFPSIGVDKNLRAGVWKSGKFSRIKARCPDGGEIYWSMCNHCGMVYKGSTLPAALEKHTCDCSCRRAPNS